MELRTIYPKILYNLALDYKQKPKEFVKKRRLSKKSEEK